MSVNEFMSGEENFNTIRDKIIKNTLPNTFDSHEFIRHFAKEFELTYVKFLNQHNSEPFRKVHVQIGKFLSVNQNKLNIVEKGKAQSLNVFGIKSSNEKWCKNNGQD